MIITKYKRNESCKLTKVVVFRSIGNVFNLVNKMVRVKKANIKKHCLGCVLEKKETCSQYKDITGYCYSTARADKKNVIFLECNIVYATIYKVLSKILGLETEAK